MGPTSKGRGGSEGGEGKRGGGERRGRGGEGGIVMALGGMDAPGLTDKCGDDCG